MRRHGLIAVGLVLSAAPALQGVGATLALVAEFDGRMFAVSHDGAKFAVITGPSICVHPVAEVLAAKCFHFPAVLDPDPTTRVQWSPDGRFLGVTGPSGDDGKAVWVIDVSRLELPESVWAADEAQPPRSTRSDARLYAWVSPTLLIFGADSWFRTVDAASKQVSEFCSFTDLSGGGYFGRVPQDSRLLGSNRFGDILEVRATAGATGRPSVSCHESRRATLTGAGWLWPRFEDALDADRLLFSTQSAEAGVLRWQVGTALVSFDADTLTPRTDFPRGAPATVSPDGRRIAALRADATTTFLLVYDASDPSVSVQLPTALGVTPERPPLNDDEWEELSPRWSPDGELVLVEKPRAAGGGAEVFSVRDTRTEVTIDGLDIVGGYVWATARRLIVRKTPATVAIYEISD